MIKYNTMAKLKDLSVLIVTWNGDDLLNNCLSSIFRVNGDALEIEEASFHSPLNKPPPGFHEKTKPF